MLILLGVITSRATSGGRGKDRNTSGQRGNNFNRSYRNISVVVVENDVVKPNNNNNNNNFIHVSIIKNSSNETTK